MVRIREQRERLRSFRTSTTSGAQTTTQTPQTTSLSGPSFLLSDAQLRVQGRNLAAEERSASRNIGRANALRNKRVQNERKNLRRELQQLRRDGQGDTAKAKNLEAQIRLRTRQLAGQASLPAFNAREQRLIGSGQASAQQAQTRRERLGSQLSTARARAPKSFRPETRLSEESEENFLPGSGVSVTKGGFSTGIMRAGGAVSETSISPRATPLFTTGVTQANIGVLTTPRTTGGVTTPTAETRLEGAIGRATAREEAQAERVQRSKDIFRAIPGLRGDNFAQRTTRGLLATPALLTVGLGGTLANLADRGQIAGRALINPNTRAGATRELRSAVREAPGSFARSLDPRGPDGAAPLIIIGGLGVAGVRGLSTSTVGSTRGVTLARQSGTSSTLTETVNLGGTFNRIAGRTGTRTTRTLPTGTVTSTLRTPTGLRITETVRGGTNILTRRTTRGGRTRVQTLTARPGATRVLEFQTFGRGTRPSLVAEQLQPNIVRQTVTRADDLNALGTLDGVTNVGVLRTRSSTQSLSRLGPTRGQVITRVDELGTGTRLLESSEALQVQAPLRAGGRTTRGRVARTQTEELNLNLGTREQTLGIARRPRPTSETRTVSGFEFRGPTPRTRPFPTNILPSSRRGSLLSPQRFRQDIIRPSTVGPPRAPTGTPQLSVRSFTTSSSRGFAATGTGLLQPTLQGRPVRQARQPQTLPRQGFDLRISEGSITGPTTTTDTFTTTRGRTSGRSSSSALAATSILGPTPSQTLTSPFVRTPSSLRGTLGGGFGFLPRGPNQRRRGRGRGRSSRTGARFTRGLRSIEGLSIPTTAITATRLPRGGLSGFEVRI